MLKAEAVLEKNGAVTFSQYWFANWKTRVDGLKVPAGRDKNGLIMVRVPQGRHVVEARFENTSIDNAALAASVVSWLAIAAAVLGANSSGNSGKRRKKRG